MSSYQYDNFRYFFSENRVVNVAILELRPVSNESPGNFTFFKGVKNNGFLKFYAVVFISQKIPWNGNYSPKTVIFSKIWYYKFCEEKNYCYHSSFFNGFYAVVVISQNFPLLISRKIWSLENYSKAFSGILFFQVQMVMCKSISRTMS